MTKAAIKDTTPEAINESDDFEDVQEVWDIVKVYKEGDKKAPVCSTSDCHSRSCSMWSNGRGDDWTSCEECQLKDFGGWPFGGRDAYDKFLVERASSSADSAESSATLTFESAASGEKIGKEKKKSQKEQGSSSTKNKEEPQADEIKLAKNKNSVTKVMSAISRAASLDATALARRPASSASEAIDLALSAGFAAETALRAAEATVKVARHGMADVKPIESLLNTVRAALAAERATGAASIATAAAAISTGDLNADEMDYWDILETLPTTSNILELAAEDTIVCQTEGCNMFACALWQTVLTKKKKFVCEDCQRDFGGGEGKVTVTADTGEDADATVGHDSSSLMSLQTPLKRGRSSLENPALVSPCPSTNRGVPAGSLADNFCEEVEDSNNKNEGTPSIAPTTKNMRKRVIDDDDDDDESADAAAPPPPDAVVLLKKSKSTTALEKAWVAEAKKFDPDAKSVVTSFVDACSMIQRLLRDAAAPKNVTQLHIELKGQVPAPLLKKALDTMVENGVTLLDPELPKKEFDIVDKATVLKVKHGKTPSNTIYYCWEEDAPTPHDHQLTLSELYALKREFDTCESESTRASNEVKRLLNEALNEDLDSMLETTTHEVEDLSGKVEYAKANFLPGSSDKIRKAHDYYVGEWNSRKRKCMAGLETLESITDGVVTVSKCLKGDGQISIESDEAALKDASTPKTRKVLGSKFGSSSSASGKRGTSDADAGTFYGLKLDKSSPTGVVRVYPGGENLLLPSSSSPLLRPTQQDAYKAARIATPPTKKAAPQPQLIEPPHPEPFAVVDTVSDNSPASESGLMPGDLILTWGAVNESNHDSLKGLSESTMLAFKHKSYLAASIKRRSEGAGSDGKSSSYVLLTKQICPREWEGKGVLGMNLVEYDHSMHAF